MLPTLNANLMKSKLCFKCDKNFVPPNRTILWCDECREALKLPSVEVKPREPVKVPKIAPLRKKNVDDAWEQIEWDTKNGWLRFKYWNDLRLSIWINDIQQDPEWWAALRDIRLIIQRFRK